MLALLHRLRWLGLAMGVLAGVANAQPEPPLPPTGPPPTQLAAPTPAATQDVPLVRAPLPASPSSPARILGGVPPRGLWVLCQGSQRVLENPERLAWLLDDAAALGVSDLFVQVYRAGRAWFPSSYADSAPYAGVWHDQDGDALQVLIRAAHARGLRVHAWVNVLSLATNPQAPIIRALGRDAVLSDQKGRSLLDYPDFAVPPPDGRYYRMGTPAVYLDPAAPGVAEHLAAAFAELVALYPGFDGLHLDYIRYPDVLPFSPGTRFGVGLSFGHGEATRARFRAETGLTAPFGDSLMNGNRFDDWRRAKLSELVERVGMQARAARPGLAMSAAVWAYPDRAYLAIFQDWRGWLDAGLLDFAVPMIYSKDDRLLRYRIEGYAGLPYANRIWAGLGVWLFANEPARALAQLRTTAAHGPLGSALFSWDSLRSEPALLEHLIGGLAPGASPPARLD